MQAPTLLRFLSLLFGLALAGCVGVSRPPAVSADLPQAFPAYDDAAGPGPGGDGALPGWRSFFSDPGLVALIEAALAHNRDLRVVQAQVEEARALYGIQSAARLPEIDVNATGTRGRTPADLSLTGVATVAGQYRVGLALPAFEIDFWGRVRSLEQAALAQYLSTEEARTAFELSLVATVANSYLLARELDERIVLARRTLESREESLRIMRRRAEVGVSSDLEVRQVEGLLLATRGELATLERLRAQNEALLQQLAGHALPADPPGGLETQGLPEALPAGLPSALLARRPDLRAAEQRLRAAEANVGAARAAFFPNISLTGFAGTASAELDGLFRAGSGSWSFTPVLHLPLFDGGRLRANLDLAEARRNGAVAGYEADVQTAFREVAEALAAHHWLGRQVAAQGELVAAERERARLAELRYERGVSSYLDVLDAQRGLFAAEQALVQLRRARMSAMVDLYKTLGGGQLP
ncbi:efflux transporter outer membrane subunit [Pseudothauera rhizosphaerae]|nr:efflux transporter outer membrane subunit [Pseudothauera rhizosphaerae]